GNSDDDFTSLHQYQADQLATGIETDYPAFDATRIFMGSYKKKVQPNGETVPEMEDDIKRCFDQGAIIINFTGHGSEVIWTDERIFTEKTIEGLSNDRYPFLVTATCEFGRQDDPQLISSAERSVTKKNGGTIGLVTTARPVNATTNFNLNEAFYSALFNETAEGYPTIGEVFRQTKNNSTSGVANRNFSLIGDPSMVLALPEYSIGVTEVKTAGGSDTLKALSTVTARGRVEGADGQVLASFNGVVEATLFDKEEEFVTIGKNDPPFQYSQWENAVFRGRATVSQGVFEFSFVMPKNIAYQIGKGKFSFYAFDPASGADAKGVYASPIGGSERNPAGDAWPPLIELFMGDTTFIGGGVTTSDTYLIARLQDENGINISGYGIGNSIIAQLDDDAATFVLNDYYVSDVDTYKKGSIRFPILGLAPGKHTLTVKAWDVYNNPAEATIAFVVTDGEGLVIEDFGNYPNPFGTSTTLFFNHNRSGDDLRAQLFIYSELGELVKSAEMFIPESEYHINLMELDAFEDAGKKLPPGLYLARLVVRSMTNGSKNERVTKLIVVN
ncbi:MAG TPA: type IX secretion system sortase PorU, partial [Chryseosolibacter sp.]